MATRHRSILDYLLSCGINVEFLPMMQYPGKNEIPIKVLIWKGTIRITYRYSFSRGSSVDVKFLLRDIVYNINTYLNINYLEWEHGFDTEREALAAYGEGKRNAIALSFLLNGKLDTITALAIESEKHVDEPI